MLKRASVYAVVLIALVVLGLPVAHAGTRNMMKVHVPFDFYLRDRVLPAGEYSIRELTEDGAVVRVADEDSREGTITLTNGSTAEKGQPAAPHLLFRRYGEQYFLAGVWLHAGDGRAITQSRRERSLRRELARGGREARPEVVMLAADVNGR